MPTAVATALTGVSAVSITSQAAVSALSPLMACDRVAKSARWPGSVCWPRRRASPSLVVLSLGNRAGLSMHRTYHHW